MSRSPHPLPTPADGDRRDFLRRGLASGLALSGLAGLSRGPNDASAAPVTDGAGRWAASQAVPFELEEATVAELQAGLASGRYTAQSLVERYLARIGQLDRDGPQVRAVIETNPDAPAIAAALDEEQRTRGRRGPLHGIPVLIKDNIDTGDRMMTSAGSWALADAPAPQDAEIARRLRAAGAVILGKTNLSEWANFRSTHSSSGWSGRGGQTRNPYALDRNPCGSSSGTGAAIAASFAAVGIGTETDGSIVCPSNANGLVGIKPTVGLVSRSGIVPISHSQDTAGPMCRTVMDAAILLGAIAGADTRDPATAGSSGHVEADYTRFCDPAGLRGARIGVVRSLFNAGPPVDAVIADVLGALRDGGAELVDPVEVASSGRFDDAENVVLLHEFKADLARYLATRGPGTPFRTLAELIAYNEAHRDREMAYFGQELFLQSQAKGPLTAVAYRDARARCVRLTRGEGIDLVLRRHRLHALLAPTGGPAWTTDLVNGDHFTGGSSSLAAVSGYPAITVPAGAVFGLPVGVTFFGGAWSEGLLIRLAYAFEQQGHARRAPRFLATADLAP
jgi:amidase